MPPRRTWSEPPLDLIELGASSLLPGWPRSSQFSEKQGAIITEFCGISRQVCEDHVAEERFMQRYLRRFRYEVLIAAIAVAVLSSPLIAQDGRFTIRPSEVKWPAATTGGAGTS